MSDEKEENAWAKVNLPQPTVVVSTLQQITPLERPSTNQMKARNVSRPHSREPGIQILTPMSDWKRLPQTIYKLDEAIHPHEPAAKPLLIQEIAGPVLMKGKK